MIRDGSSRVVYGFDDAKQMVPVVSAQTYDVSLTLARQTGGLYVGSRIFYAGNKEPTPIGVIGLDLPDGMLVQKAIITRQVDYETGQAVKVLEVVSQMPDGVVSQANAQVSLLCID